ncbi:unnamed protein product [Adineta ricciae]|uniref:VCBS repeat-containing protein n=1 Tax=Adineta ricciae TaxID=249248 RepID=A0A814VWK5_ADIRI|nr:unnamed protein product [Adineta ricciae]
MRHTWWKNLVEIGICTTQTTYSTGLSPWSIATGDLNKDALLDIVVANYGDDSISIFFGQPNGSFLSQTILTTGLKSEPYSISVGDFNQDTLLDIIVMNNGVNNVYVFLGYGNGTFKGLTVFSIGFGSLPISLAVGDFNNDEKLDFAIANEGTDNLKIILQTC